MNTPNETKKIRPTFWMRAIEGRKNHLTREYRATLGDTAREGISDEDYATTMATLEKMARNLGWDESQRHEHGFGPRRGRGFGHGPHFGHHPHPGFDGHGRFDGPHDHEDHHGHDERPDARKAEENRPNETPEA
jgi:hypothetical protein